MNFLVSISCSSLLPCVMYGVESLIMINVHLHILPSFPPSDVDGLQRSGGAETCTLDQLRSLTTNSAYATLTHPITQAIQVCIVSLVFMAFMFIFSMQA